MALALGDAYTDMPFHDDNWVLVRHRHNRKTYAFTFERQGHIWVNLKFPADWRDFFRDVYPSVRPAYHMNKEHWSSVILDGSIPDDEIARMMDKNAATVRSRKSRALEKMRVILQTAD